MNNIHEILNLQYSVETLMVPTNVFICQPCQTQLQTTIDAIGICESSEEFWLHGY